jgi:hypothetical protein
VVDPKATPHTLNRFTLGFQTINTGRPSVFISFFFGEETLYIFKSILYETVASPVAALGEAGFRSTCKPMDKA